MNSTTEIAHRAHPYASVERAAVDLVAHRVSHTALVVVVHPSDLDASVIAHDDHIGLRAATRVAAAANNQRAWRDVLPVVQRLDVAQLPPVIGLAAKRDRVRTCHVAGIYHDDRLAAVALWFSRRERDTAATEAYRNETFAALQAAARAS